MKKCPFCAEDIQEAAIICRYCSSDFRVGPNTAAPTAPTSTPPVVAQPSPPKKSSRGWAIILGLILLWIVGAFLLPSRNTPDPRRTSTITPKGTLNVSVRSSTTVLEVTNNGSREAAGHVMVVYINGSPPFTYKAESTVPPLGEIVSIPLNMFTKKDGRRFNPFATAVTVIWVGGGGYDYRSFGK